MRKILLQLDTDEHPSPFDAIVAYDAGVDVVLPYPGVTPPTVRKLVQGAFFTRGVGDLATIAVWIGGSSVPLGEEILEQVQDACFGPFRVSIMLDTNGCNTTAGTAIAMIGKARDLTNRRAVIVGAGPVGLRSATLLIAQGCEVTVCGIPPEVFGADRPYRSPAGLAIAKRMGLHVVEPADRAGLAAVLQDAWIVLCAGPSGIPILRQEDWLEHPAIEVLADYNAAEPLGIEGVKATDALVERNGKLVLGALGVGELKMRVHKACVRRLFERNDLVLDVDGVYAVAAELA